MNVVNIMHVIALGTILQLIKPLLPQATLKLTLHSEDMWATEKMGNFYRTYS